MQKTLAQSVTINGIGLHSGTEVCMTVKPGQPDTGIVFVRTDVNGKNNVIPARWDSVVDTRLCTVIGNDDGVTVGTIEHLMAALRGCGVDNAVIRIDGPEVPVMDGSSQYFVDVFQKTGLEQQATTQRRIKVLKDVEVREGDKFVRLSPGELSVFGGSIDFAHSAIGKQSHEITLVNGNFAHDLANCRTFGFVHEVEALRKAGLALGGSLDNAIVLDETKVLNEGGLRREDEFIRHKLLDAIGDLYLAGASIAGTYDCYKPSHALNNAILHKLFSDSDNWCFEDEYVPVPAASAERAVYAS